VAVRQALVIQPERCNSVACRMGAATLFCTASRLRRFVADDETRPASRGLTAR
jgi:hypothetical protein